MLRVACHTSLMKNPLRHCPTWPCTWFTGVVTVIGMPVMKSATAWPVMAPLKLNKPRGLLAARRPVAILRTSNPVRMLCVPLVQDRTLDIWNVVSNWYQLVPPLPRPENPVMPIVGMPGLS